MIAHNVRSTISVVIVAGACGIAAGTPLAILGAMDAPRNSVRLSGGPLPVTTGSVTAESRSEHPVGKAILKKTSNMGISGEEPERFEYTPGKGVVATRDSVEILGGNRLFLEGHRIDVPRTDGPNTESEVFVARGGSLPGTLVVADKLRLEATKAIRDLKAMGLKTVRLTGDGRAVAEDIGKKLGVDEIAAELFRKTSLSLWGG